MKNQQNEEKMKIKFGNYNIVAETENYDGEHPELSVYLQDKDGNSIQNIAIIRPHDNLKSDTDKGKKQSVDCLVWGDVNDEDYTSKFVIKVLGVDSNV